MQFGKHGWQVWCQNIFRGTAPAEATEFYAKARPHTPYRFKRVTVYLNNTPGAQCVHHLTYQGRRVMGGDDKLI